jgi:DNA modification methylase
VSLPTPFYQDASCTIYNADCREILPLLPRFDLLLTDPPYGYEWNTNYSRFLKGSTDKEAITNDSKGEIDLSPCIELTSEQIIFGCNSIPQSKVGSYLIWDKRCADGFSFLSDGEAAWWSEGHGVYICTINAQQHRSKAGLHPTQKPVGLMTWCINKAKQAQTILDPFMGSGTTLVAAKLEGRKAVGIEINKKYCEIAANRLRQSVFAFDEVCV